MARKDDLKNKAGRTPGSGTQKPVGWQGHITGGVQAKKQKAYLRKTYLMTPELVADVEGTAERLQVGINELVRFLLTTALAQVDRGELEIPTELEERRRITG